MSEIDTLQWIRKIRTIFDIEKWLWKSEFCNFAGLITSTENVKKNFNAIFVISGALASVWKVFIKFRWHGQKLIAGMYYKQQERKGTNDAWGNW